MSKLPFLALALLFVSTQSARAGLFDGNSFVNGYGNFFTATAAATMLAKQNQKNTSTTKTSKSTSSSSSTSGTSAEDCADAETNTYTSYGVRNGGRRAWRLPKSGARYGSKVTVTFTSGYTVKDFNGANREDDRDGFVWRPGGDCTSFKCETSHGGVYLHAPYGDSSTKVTVTGGCGVGEEDNPGTSTSDTESIEAVKQSFAGALGGAAAAAAPAGEASSNPLDGTNPPGNDDEPEACDTGIHDDTYDSYGVRNGGRRAWRLPKSGARYGTNVKVNFSSGYSHGVFDGTEREAKNDGFVWRPGGDCTGFKCETSHGGVYLHAPYGDDSTKVTVCYGE